MLKRLKAGSNSDRHLAAGDAARDSADWRGAVAEYELYLAAQPQAASIWVQLGNCAKEAGEYAKSQAAYNQSLSLAPNVADTHLQLGHLNKLMGRMNAALLHYRRALELDPKRTEVNHEIASLQKTIDNLPFLLPANFLDTKHVESMEDLIQLCQTSNLSNDPFHVYYNLISE